MPVCGVRGCVNTKVSSSGGRKGALFRRHNVPQKEPARTTWLRLIGRDAVSQDTEIVVCGLHFRSDDYVLNMALADASGVGKFRGRLRPGVTPSLNLPTGSQHAMQQENKANLCILDSCDCQAGDCSTAWTASALLASLARKKGSSYAPGTSSAFPAFVSPSLDTTPPNILQRTSCECSSPSTEQKGTQYCPPKESRWTQTRRVQTRTAGMSNIRYHRKC
ncbi:uncharacterized protein LOC135388788 isoform X2 [Ornithodoros turicata]|uniref:uncharacterized protein LOC135388788 isoform X2 n=1 Tax=Ornithodoros turicata TaxID=34597 RepID=UPI003138ABC0